MDGLNCGYAPGSWELEYCQDITTFQSYPGSMSKIVGAFINRPMSNAAGIKFQYTNENFMILTYLIEKLSGISYNHFLQTHVSSVIGLTSTYYDPLEGSLALKDKKLSEGFRHYHDLTQTDNLDRNYFTSSICSDEFNMGAFCGTGGMVSNPRDMHHWYHSLFVERNPALLSDASITALITPYVLTGTRDTYDAYFGQGVGVDVRHGESQPYSVYYTGNLICSATSIRLLLPTPDDPPVLSIVFRNSVVVNATENEHTESQLAAAGTFYDAAFITYGWESYGDSRAHAENLVNFFLANPDAKVSEAGESDDSLGSGELVGIVVGAVLLAVLVVCLLLYFAKKQKSSSPLSGGANSSSTDGKL